MTPNIGDHITINGNLSGIVFDICDDPKYNAKHSIDTRWIWIEYKEKGRKKRTRIPECNLAAYNPVINKV